MKKGFTILEMILVLTVTSIIILVTVPNIAQKRKIINNVGCDALLEVVNGQILLFELEKGREPSDISELVRNGYLTSKQTVCPMGDRIEIDDGQAKAY